METFNDVLLLRCEEKKGGGSGGGLCSNWEWSQPTLHGGDRPTAAAAAATVPLSRTSFASCVIGSGGRYLYIQGGQHFDASTHEWRVLDDAWLLDMLAWRWFAVPPEACAYSAAGQTETETADVATLVPVAGPVAVDSVLVDASAVLAHGGGSGLDEPACVFAAQGKGRSGESATVIRDNGHEYILVYGGQTADQSSSMISEAAGDAHWATLSSGNDVSASTTTAAVTRLKSGYPCANVTKIRVDALLARVGACPLPLPSPSPP
jgi:hypothetical protein